MFRHTARAQPTHTTHNTHKRGEVWLCRVTWDSYVRIPPLLLGKWSTTGSLSQNLFCHLQENGEWLTILKSLKKNKKTKKKTKQTRMLLRANPTNTKRIQSLWCPSGALVSNFSEQMPISMFLKANVQRLISYQKLWRLNSLSVPSGVINLSMSHGGSTTHHGDASALPTFRRKGVHVHTKLRAQVLWRKVIPWVCGGNMSQF